MDQVEPFGFQLLMLVGNRSPVNSPCGPLRAYSVSIHQTKPGASSFHIFNEAPDGGIQRLTFLPVVKNS